ncbi:nucleotide exchange factor SIL1-like isoform X2 [Parus major]|uniref:nucleotide exchange factor SIL1-like isoform X2 n=1 Tax=Parus major TaxID=9157 RepID=UPI0007711E00|nr:nucleotide exchange factor SIL1-like isoform X2 [Parus major]
MFLRAKPCFCMRLVAMPRWAGLLSSAARASLLLLLGSLLFSCPSLSHRAPEFALTKIEESDIKDASGKEPVTEDDADPEDLEVFYPTDQWQSLRPGQAVPAGSHVRLNLETGEREAKLPDRENGESGTKEERRRKRYRHARPCRGGLWDSCLLLEGRLPGVLNYCLFLRLNCWVRSSAVLEAEPCSL